MNRFLILSLIFLMPLVSFGAVRSSTTYSIERDSLNIGGESSTSTSYGINDTVGEQATGESSSTTYAVNAGFQLPDNFLSITSPTDVALTTFNTTRSDSTTSGSAAWTIVTDNTAGYTMTIEASTVPALQSAGSTFDDYTPTGGADFAFTTGASESLFGFSPEGDDIADSYKDDGATCGSGATGTADACWDGLSTSSQTIAGSTSSNQPSGTATTVKFKAEIGSEVIQDAGTYTATVTVTAVVL